MQDKYDGTIESLADKSGRPRKSPIVHVTEEINMIKDYKYNKTLLLESTSITEYIGLYREIT